MSDDTYFLSPYQFSPPLRCLPLSSDLWRPAEQQQGGTEMSYSECQTQSVRHPEIPPYHNCIFPVTRARCSTGLRRASLESSVRPGHQQTPSNKGGDYYCEGDLLKHDSSLASPWLSCTTATVAVRVRDMAGLLIRAVLPDLYNNQRPICPASWQESLQCPNAFLVTRKALELDCSVGYVDSLVVSKRLQYIEEQYSSGGDGDHM